MDSICLITGPRTGADALGTALAGFPEMAVFGEIFGADSLAGVPPAGWPLLRQRLDIDFEDGRDFRLATHNRDNPTAWLDALEEVAGQQGKRVTSFVLVHNDLPVETAVEQLLGRGRLRAVLIVRKQIDSYVEMREADAALTGDKGPVTLDADAFEAWLGALARWYAHWRDALNRRFLPCPVLRFETDIAQPADRVRKRFAGVAAQVGILLKPPAAMADNNEMPQAAIRPLIERVANWPAFSRELAARGIERRAFGYPL